MKKNVYVFSLLLVCFISSAFAQIQFQNPSFEGTPQPHVPPTGWSICPVGLTPDTQPGSWGQTLPASNGNTYVGLVNQPSSGWQEGVGQDLITPLVAGTPYSFSIDLAVPVSADPTTGIIIPPYCVQLQLWGGIAGVNSGCDLSELLWTSPFVTNTSWQTYGVSFMPTSNWSHLTFQIYTPPPACTDGQYIYVDNISTVPSAAIANHNLTICSNPATISAVAGFTQYLWSTGSTTQTTTVTSSGLYYVTATLNSLVLVDSVNVTLSQPYLNLNLGNDTTICGNANLTLNAGSGFIQYLWNTWGTTQTINVSTSGIYTALAKDTGNCLYIDSINVIINPSQSLHLGNDTALCHYAPFILDAGIAFNSYLWSTGATTQSIAVNTTGTYYVTATNNQCSTTVYDTITVILYPAPNANAGPDDTICYVSSVVLQATGGSTYAWSPSTGLSATNISNPTANPAYSTIYTVTVSNINGCSASDNVAINVFNGFINSVNSSCGMNNGTASAFSTGGTGNNTYIWNTTPQQTTQTISNLSPGTYTVSITDVGIGCNVVKSINISNIAPPTLNVAGVTNTSCGMSSGSVNVNVYGGTPPYTYHWNSNPPQTSNNLTNVPVGYYCLTVTDTPGCVSSVCDSVTVDAYSAPEICMVTVDTATNHNLIVWEKPVSTGINYYMIFRETNISGVYNMIGTQNYSNFSTYVDVNSNPQQQSYRYELAINDNCGFTSLKSAYHETLHVSISAGMSGAWNLNWNSYTGYSYSTYNIYRGSSYGNMVLINSVSSNVNSYTDLTPPPGVLFYMVEAVRPTACNPTAKSGDVFRSSISNIASTYNLGIDESNANGAVQIYPNPGNGILTISITNPVFGNADIEILNSLGQVVYNYQQTEPTEKIDISGFAQGVYFIRVRGNDRTAVIKFVKE